MGNISKELCIICGIEPISRCDYCPRNNCIGSTACKRGEEVRYPDFTQPENFVKLLELKFTTKRGASFTIVEVLQLSRGFTFTDRKTFLSQLLEYMATCENFGAYIKQAIRAEAWIYE